MKLLVISPPLVLFWVCLFKFHSVCGFQSAPLTRRSRYPARATSLLHKITALGFSIDVPQKISSASTLSPSKSLSDPAKTKEPKKKHAVYKHLFRNYGDISFDSWLRCQDPESFLKSVGYSTEEIQGMENEFPPLLSLNVHDQLAPKVRFLVETLEGGSGRLTWNDDDDEQGDSPNIQSPALARHAHPVGQIDDECAIFLEAEQDGTAAVHSMRVSPSTRAIVPATFFGCQLDRIVGPFHAYLHVHGLPHGRALLEEPKLLGQFLRACCNSPNAATALESFAGLCQEWGGCGAAGPAHTKDDVEEFVGKFGPGLLPAARAGLAGQYGRSLIPTLLLHGANPLECDSHGVAPFLYAAGSGDLGGFQALADVTRTEHGHASMLETLDCEREPRYGATALHWACCGVGTHFAGGGGSFDVCRWILEQAGEDREAVANLASGESKSTPLMWAAWAGSLEIVDLLLLHGANLEHTDGKGRNAFHWSAAAGHMDVVEFLMKQRGGREGLNHVDHDGKCPVDYARMYDRQDVARGIDELNRETLLATTVWTV